MPTDHRQGTKKTDKIAPDFREGDQVRILVGKFCGINATVTSGGERIGVVVVVGNKNIHCRYSPRSLEHRHGRTKPRAARAATPQNAPEVASFSTQFLGGGGGGSGPLRRGERVTIKNHFAFNGFQATVIDPDVITVAIRLNAGNASSCTELDCTRDQLEGSGVMGGPCPVS